MSDQVPVSFRGSGELHARLTALGRLIGVPITVSEDSRWELSEAGLTVGLGFFAERGHSPDESVALSLLAIWCSVRAPITAPRAVERAASIVRSRPELDPLVQTVQRLIAGRELLRALPALRIPLGAAIAREIPSDAQHLPLHLQWTSVLSATVLATDRQTVVAEPVAAEFHSLDRQWRGSSPASGKPGPALTRMLAPDAPGTSLQRFERALGALLEPYLRLMIRDAGRRGLENASATGQEVTDSKIDGTDQLESLVPPGGGGNESTDVQSELNSDLTGDEAAADTAPMESSREREEEEQSRGFDPASLALDQLFASDHADYLRHILPTPLPHAAAVATGQQEQPFDVAEHQTASVAQPGAQSGGSAPKLSASLGAYRARALKSESAIEQMRMIWQRQLISRVADRRGLSRTAETEGEVLASDQLAQVIAEIHAGVHEPRAFRRRVHRLRRTKAPGNTDFVLAIDRSGSMQGVAAEYAADAAMIMLEGIAAASRDIENAEVRARADLELALRTSLIVFDAQAHVIKPLAAATDDRARAALYAAVRSPSGATNDRAALRAAAAQLGVGDARGEASEPVAAGQGTQRRRVVIVVSDGGSNDPAATSREISRLRALGVRVWGVGIGNVELFERYAPTGLRIDHPRDLPDALRGIIEYEHDE